MNNVKKENMNTDKQDNNYDIYNYDYDMNDYDLDKKSNFNFIDRFLYKLFISFILLFTIILLDKYHYLDINKIKEDLNGNINVLEVVNLINGNINIIDLGTEEETTVSTSLDGVFIDDTMKVVTNSYYGVKCVICGVVTKIVRNNGFIEVTILGIDDISYVYSHLQSVDINIYQYVKTNAIIGNTDSYYEVTRSFNN